MRKGYHMTYQAMFKKVQGFMKKADASVVNEHLALQFNVEGDGEGIFYIEAVDSELKVEPYDYCDHDAMIIGSAVTMLAVLGSKEDMVEALEAGTLKVEGNYEKALLLKAMLPVKKAPAKKAPAKKSTAAKSTATKKTTATKTTAAKTTAAKTTATKAAATKTTVAKTTAAKTTAAKTTAAKTTAAKTTATKKEVVMSK